MCNDEATIVGAPRDGDEPGEGGVDVVELWRHLSVHHREEVHCPGERAGEL